VALTSLKLLVPEVETGHAPIGGRGHFAEKHFRFFFRRSEQRHLVVVVQVVAQVILETGREKRNSLAIKIWSRPFSCPCTNLSN